MAEWVSVVGELSAICQLEACIRLDFIRRYNGDIPIFKVVRDL